MTLNLTVPAHHVAADFQPRITVIGVGGGGCNAVNNMIASDLEGVDFIVANTDAQSLLTSRAERRIQLGLHKTQGLGAGARPDVGREAAEEALGEIETHLTGAHMLFITAGMGGGTGTGAAPVIARMARERGILTVGVVTKPFDFEGPKRRRVADEGIDELQQYVDTLIVIPNQNLFRLATEKTTFAEAFKMADNVLHMGVRGVTDLIVRPGLVNLDFADIRTVMGEMGKAMMGTGEAEGEKRAEKAAEAAISNPLLDDTSVKGAHGVLINITGGLDVTLFEIDEAANRIRREVEQEDGAEANIIFGAAIDPAMEGRIRVSVVATGIESAVKAQPRPERTLHVVGNTARVGQVRPAPAMPAREPVAAPRMMPLAGFAQVAAPVAAPVAQPIAQAQSQAQLQARSLAAAQAVQLAQAALAMPEPEPVSPEPGLMESEPGLAASPPAGGRLTPSTSPLFEAEIQETPPPAPAQPAPPAPPAAPAPEAARPRRNPFSRLFREATGVARSEPALGQAAAPAAAQPAAPAYRGRADQPTMAEPSRVSARPPAAEDDLGLDIPTFLRRQAN